MDSAHLQRIRRRSHRITVRHSSSELLKRIAAEREARARAAAAAKVNGSNVIDRGRRTSAPKPGPAP